MLQDALEPRQEMDNFAWGRKSGNSSGRKKDLISILKHGLALKAPERWKDIPSGRAGRRTEA